MSMHLKPLTHIEEAGLRAHGLPVGGPSQLADAFRLGMAWAEKTRAEATPAEPPPDADGWIPWAGGECPVDSKDWVEAKLRDGEAWIDEEGRPGEEWLWDHDGGADDIIAYRVVKR